MATNVDEIIKPRPRPEKIKSFFNMVYKVVDTCPDKDLVKTWKKIAGTPQRETINMRLNDTKRYRQICRPYRDYTLYKIIFKTHLLVTHT